MLHSQMSAVKKDQSFSAMSAVINYIMFGLISVLSKNVDSSESEY